MNGPATQATAKQWLQGHGSQAQIRAALNGVLVQIWRAGFQAGLQAVALLGLAAVGLLVADLISQLTSAWLDEITDTRLDRLAAVLAAGGSVEELEDGIFLVLHDDYSAQMIAQTELARADNAARMAAFRADRINEVIWVTTSANPCPECVMNEAAGPWPLGQPFPSGVIAPPDHPHCQCHLEPA